MNNIAQCTGYSNVYKMNFKANNDNKQTQMMPVNRQQLEYEKMQKKQNRQSTTNKIASWVGIGSGLAIIGFLVLSMRGMGGKSANSLKAAIEKIQDPIIKQEALTELEKGPFSYSAKKINDLIKLSNLKNSQAQKVDLERAKEIMDKKLVDMQEVKEQIMKFLVDWNYNVEHGVKNTKPLVICLDGPAGTGKTTASQVLAEAIGCPYKKVPLGGAAGSSIIRGTESKFVGAEAGSIARAQIDSGSKRIVYCLDEAEKVAKDSQHGDPHAAMAALTDGSGKFQDDFLNVSIDTSESIFVLTTNEFNKLPDYIQSRVRLMQISPYNNATKSKIAKVHLDLRLEDLHMKDLIVVQDNAYKSIAAMTKDQGGRDTTKNLDDLLLPAIKTLETLGIKEGNVIKLKDTTGRLVEAAKLDPSGKIIIDDAFVNRWLNPKAPNRIKVWDQV